MIVDGVTAGGIGVLGFVAGFAANVLLDAFQDPGTPPCCRPKAKPDEPAHMFGMPPRERRNPGPCCQASVIEPQAHGAGRCDEWPSYEQMHPQCTCLGHEPRCEDCVNRLEGRGILSPFEAAERRSRLAPPPPPPSDLHVVLLREGTGTRIPCAKGAACAQCYPVAKPNPENDR